MNHLMHGCSGKCNTSLSQADKLDSQADKLDSQADKLEYTRIRRETKKLIKISKKLHELHIASNCKVNPKEFFRYVRKRKP